MAFRSRLVLHRIPYVFRGFVILLLLGSWELVPWCHLSNSVSESFFENPFSNSGPFSIRSFLDKN